MKARELVLSGLTKRQKEWLEASLEREKDKMPSLSINGIEEYVSYLLRQIETR